MRIGGIGKLGEDIACRFLLEHGYSVIDRNYLKKWGEIDIVAKNKEGLCIIEVKTVSREKSCSVSHETSENVYRPEDNMHDWKKKRLMRVIQTYLADKKVSQETNWRFGVIAITLSVKDKKAYVKFLKDIILE